MNSFQHVPVTAGIFAMVLLLSGCMAYDAASTVVSAGSSVVGAGVSVVGAAGDVVTSPFDSGEAEKHSAR